MPMTDNDMVEYVRTLVEASNDQCVKFSIPLADKNLLGLEKRPNVRGELAKKHNIIFNFKANELSISKIGADADAISGKPVVDRSKHTYVAPPFHDDVKKIIKDVVPYNIWFYGSSATGKSRYVRYLSVELGNEMYKQPIPVFQINGRADMDSSGFFGDRTIEIDEATKQNKIVVKEGPVVRAMTAGLNKSGEPTQVGDADFAPPAILFVDEAAVLPPHIAIGLNRLLETDNPRREVALDFDGGRVVRSHPGFRIILAANTLGRGLIGGNDALYTAQANALDISTLNRMTATFRFGYLRRAEDSIMNEKIGDRRIIKHLTDLRDVIRLSIQKKETSTPFTTRDIVAICDLYRVWNSLPKAIYYGIMTKLPPDELPRYNEFCKTKLNVDILATYAKTDEMDFMD